MEIEVNGRCEQHFLQFADHLSIEIYRLLVGDALSADRTKDRESLSYPTVRAERRAVK